MNTDIAKKSPTPRTLKRKILMGLAAILILLVVYTGHSSKNINYEEIDREKGMDLIHAYQYGSLIHLEQRDEKGESSYFHIDLAELDRRILDANIVANNILKLKKDKTLNLENKKTSTKFGSDYGPVANDNDIGDNNSHSGIANNDGNDITYNNVTDNDFAELAHVSEKYREIPIISKNEWTQYVIPPLAKKIIEFVPLKQNVGLLFSLSNTEIIIYRNSKNQLGFCYPYNKPSGVSIGKTMSNGNMNKLILDILKSDKYFKKYGDTNMLIFQQGYRQANHPSGLINLKENRIFYFDYQALYDFKRNIVDIYSLLALLSSLIIKSHIYAILKNPITSFSKLAFIGRNHLLKIFSSSRIKLAKNIAPLNTDGKSMDRVVFNDLLDREIGNDVYRGNFKLLIDGDEYFLELLKEIEKAKNSIKFRLYIFDNDDYGTMVAQLLRDANLTRNVQVRVLMDSYANITKSVELPPLPFQKDFRQPKSIKLFLKRGSGVQAKTSPNTWFSFDHVKTLIFDDAAVFTGGMNIGQEYRYSWHDLMIKLRGPVVKAIAKEFDNQWAKNDLLGDGALLAQKIINRSDGDIKSMPSSADSINFRLLHTKPWRRDIFKAQMLAIANSKSYIYIENPYLADRRIINELLKARARGVDVRIILPEQNNVYLMAKNNNYLINIFIENGIRVFLYPGMTHVKASIYDGWAMVGSANFDRLSYDINGEFDVAFDDENAVSELKKRLFEKDFGISKEITDVQQLGFGNELFSILADQF